MADWRIPINFLHLISRRVDVVFYVSTKAVSVVFLIVGT